MLKKTYLACLEKAKEQGLHSIAFPCISTGEFHFPKDQAAEIAISTVSNWLQKVSYPLTVIFVLYSEQDRNYYTKALSKKEVLK